MQRIARVACRRNPRQTVPTMSPFQQTKLAIVHHLGLAKDALHIYVALIVFFGACLVFRWRVTQWKPLAAVLAAALLGEAWDLRDSLVYHTRVNLWGNGHDIWNTMLAPTMLMLAARYTTVFRRS
jgi:hypothetical protein